MPTTIAAALEPLRRYLGVLARVHLHSSLRSKLDPADLVQQTLLRPSAALQKPAGRTPEALAAWLRRILTRTLTDTVRHYHRDRRNVDSGVARAERRRRAWRHSQARHGRRSTSGRTTPTHETESTLPQDQDLRTH